MEVAQQQDGRVRPAIIAYGLRGLLIFFGAAVFASYAYLLFSSFTSRNFAPELIIIPIVACIPFILGWLIDRKHPGHRIALLFLVMAYASALSIIVQAAAQLHEARASQWLSPGAESIMRVLGHSLWIPSVFIPLFLTPLFFPTGRLLSARWRPVVLLLLINVAWMLIASALRPWPWPAYGIPDTRPAAVNGIAGSEAFFDASLTVQEFIFTPILVLALFSSLIRYRRSQGVEREQMKWPILALMFIVVMIIIRVLIPELEVWEAAAGYPLTWTMAMLLPIAIGIAILRQRLWDIDIVISRTLIYGGLSAVIVALYLTIVGLLGFLFQTQTNAYFGLAAAVIIALLFQPLRERLQRGVNRLLYGQRDDPTAVLSRLAHNVQAAESPTAILPTLVQTIAHTLKIPYAAIWQPEGRDRVEPVAQWGQLTEPTLTVPLILQQETIGYLVVAQRGPQEPFTDQEQQLLAMIGALTTTSVRAVQLSDELHRSRRRIITAREDERRRLRRDLHDGLGPQLASQTLGLEAVAQLMTDNPDKAQDLLDSLKVQAEEATRDVRRLVYDLRPPALDDLGLAGALSQRAARYENNGPRFLLDIPQQLPDLPAALETAIYRITVEAMTNAVRHAEATRCTVRLVCEDGWVMVDVRDNGRGLPADFQAGVGVHAMQERTAELDGRFRLQSLPGGGTWVEARLPMENNGA